MSSPSIPSSPTRETPTETSATTHSPAQQESASSKLVDFSVALIVHTVTKTTSTGKGKNRKDSKIKKLSFSPRPGNYLEFLRAILSKFNEADKVKISVRSVYPFAYYYKGISKTSAPTVETEDEYHEFIETLEAKKPSAVNLLVDMADVAAKCAKKSSKDEDSDSEREETGSAAASLAVNSSAFDKAVEPWITKLKDLHKGSYDPKIAGVQVFALTPFMYREWATYIADHKATLEMPPHIPLFDPKSRHHTLVQSSISTAPSSSSGIDLSQVTNLIAAVAGLVNPRTSITPSTPPRASTRQSGAESVHGSSQVVASPSDLTRCLTYIAGHPTFGFPDVQRYEPVLRQQGIAPDVIKYITRDDLTRSPVKMNIGDAERFKCACSDWWDAPDGKCQRNEATTAALPALTGSKEAVGAPLSDSESDKRVRYERRFINSEGKVIGLATFWGLPMQRDESYDGTRTPPDLEHVGKIFFVDEANGGERVELPADHFIPELESEFNFM
ncbi:hypothetical protein LXA43DRAFT_1089566 [Ganoderma leucocontextum]|nr:hypothetical protein LXA43DRAFT_1089566 [Ganoderma leucocontextum]